MVAARRLGRPAGHPVPGGGARNPGGDRLLGARAVKLVGCWDRDTQGHLPQLPFSIYKLFFLCEATGDVRPPDALETLEIGWFGLDELPELSAGRVSARQLGRIVAHQRDPLLPTEFD